jgi:hypothetical protein
MIKIVYPAYLPRIRKEGQAEYIFDEVRKRWVVLTPEEWVRQQFLQYLVQVKHYPLSLIAVEKQLLMGDLRKRFDIVVYGKDTKPRMVVECKQMDVVLDHKVLDQVLRYNSILRVPFVVITNGSYCYGFSTEGSEPVELDSIPDF